MPKAVDAMSIDGGKYTVRRASRTRFSSSEVERLNQDTHIKTTMIRTSLGKKIPVSRWALALGLGSSLAALGAANAQQANAPADETQTAERVIVTGSNIPSAAEVGGAEVTTLDQESVVRTGTDDPQVALQMSDPAFSGGGNLGATNASINATSTNGGSAVSILGLPTLVLLDGRRIADSAALAAGGGQFQDVNLFPASLIKKIEVLKDGASAIYGSDAVGGVVNVLLNTDYQGFEISGRYGFAEKGDIADNRESAIAGFGDDKTRIVVAAQYEQQDPILFTQRTFSNSSFISGFYGSNDGYLTSNFGGKISIAGSTSYLNTGLPVGLGGAVILGPGSIPTKYNSLSQVAPVGSIPLVTYTTATGGTAQGFTASELPTGTYTGTPNLANLGSEVGITLDQDRTNAYGSVERDIIDKLLTVFGSFIYTQNYSESLLAPQPVATNSSPNASQNMVIPIGSPYNPFATTIGSALGAQGSGTTAGGETAGGLVVTNRFLATPRVFRNDTDFYRIVAGVKGELIKDYNYELAFNHSQDEIDYKNFGLIRSDLLEEALAGGYTASGVAAPAVISTNASTGVQTVTTPAGPYSKVNGVLLPALDPFAFNNPTSTENAVTGTDIRDQLSTLTVIDGALNGFPVTLPAGPLGFAVGGEYRDEGLKLNDSSENFVASVPVADVEVSRGIEAGYAELSIPVLAPSMKIKGLYSLDLDGAVRYEKYDGINSSIVPKASFVLRPTVDVALRGTFSGSFLAPNLIQTNGPEVAGFTEATDLGAGYTEQANSISTSNPHLGPTRANTWSGGLVISPSKVPGLTMSADFFHVEEEGIVSTTGAPASTILLDANALGSASPYNSYLHFGSPTGPGLTSTKAGQLTGNASDYFVVTSLANSLQQRTSAVDFNFNYDHDFGPKVGATTLGLNGTYYLQSKGNLSAGGPNFDEIGLYLGDDFGDGDYTPQYKLAPYAEYRYGGATLSALGNYIPSLRDADYLDSPTDRKGDYTTEEGFNLPKIRDYFTINMTLSYEFGLNKPNPAAPAPAPKEGKDAKGGDGKEVATSQQMAKQMTTFKLLDGLKLTFGVNNVTNGKPPLIALSPDFDNTDASIYDPYQRYFYFVVSKKF
jgi:iron complex outermembrane receptor protein